MSRGMTRSERLQEMLRLYSQRAYTDIEMSERLGIDRTTAYRDRQELDLEHHLIEVEEGRYQLDKVRYVSNIKLDRAEALTLYIGARRTSQQTRYAQTSAASSLEKLAITLQQPMAERLVRSADKILRQRSDPQRTTVFENVARAWIEGLTMRLDYRAFGTDRLRTHRFDIYLIEPSPWSDGVYLIGYSDVARRIITLKLDRVEKAILSSPFQVRPEFDEEVMLKHAWGIWGNDRTPEIVRLRFTPGRATRRLRETIWHPLEQITETDDGGCIWEAPIAEWQEMLPWIRGWGADCEVLAPDVLRREIANHITTLASNYGVTEPESAVATYLLFWAKADRRTGSIHRLVYHMIDVGLSAQALWDHSLPGQLKHDLAEWLGLSLDEMGRLIGFEASLHDLGKASPAFQDHPMMPGHLRDRIVSELRSSGLSFPKNRLRSERRSRHEVISTWSLRPVNGEQLLSAVAGWPDELAGNLAQALGGHHGAWPRPDLFNPGRLTNADTGAGEWTAARTQLVESMRQVFQPPTIAAFQPAANRDNTMLTLLSAVIAAADRIGSRAEDFPSEEEHIPLNAYVRHARQHAQSALARIQWARPAVMPDLDFERIFSFSPNAFQSEIRSALQGIALPALIIIEGPMGVGKTEIALTVYADWAKSNGNTGLYVAMPTTATTNQMHDRTTRFLTRQLGNRIEPLLVHSQALLRELPDHNDPVEEHEGDAASAQAWFLPRKKSLLAPYGVGTVDQALMSVLQTKHFFVRLLGLSHKVVIFDEVHAYDTYMSELFERLLVWLRAVGASVIVLSATLPEKTRQRLVQAYAGNAGAAIAAARYPRLTYAGADSAATAIPLTAPPTKTLQFGWLPQSEEDVVAKLRELLADGGCAAVICNTVGKAQTLFEAVGKLPDKFCDDDDLILLHARFPMAWREEIEQTVLRQVRPRSRKGKAQIRTGRQGRLSSQPR